MGNKFNQWQDREVELLRRLYDDGKTTAEIYAYFPQYSKRRIYGKLSTLFPNAEGEYTTRATRNRSKLTAIDYLHSTIPVIESAKTKYGERLTEISGSYYLDGKRILVGDLIKGCNSSIKRL